MKKIFSILILLIIAFLGASFIKDKFISNRQSNLKIEENNIECSMEDGVQTAKEEGFPDSEELITFLCSNEVGSRWIREEGNSIATKYIEDLFKKLKLDTIWNDSYLDNFEFEYEVGEFQGEEFVQYTENLSLNNVVGKITGEDASSAIVITAHLDAAGTSALDNASGIATVLKIANNLKSQADDIALKYDVIFCMTNAEMALFKGSKHFVNKIVESYDNIYNINIDCVGLKDGLPLGLKNISSINESVNLSNYVKEAFEKNDIPYEDVYSTEKVQWALEQGFGVSDYYSFEEIGIPNMHIAQQGITPYIANNEIDTVEIIDFEYIDKIANALTEFIKGFNI